MKLLLVLLLCSFSFHAWAQQDDNNIWKMNPEILKHFKGDNDSLQKGAQNYYQRKGSQNNLLSSMHGNVATLPQDHMPCIVPDTKGIAPIPNAWTGVTVPFKVQSHPIPNPALPKDSSKSNTLRSPIK